MARMPNYSHNLCLVYLLLYYKMTKEEDVIRIKILEAVLEYIEGAITFRSVLEIGVTAHSKCMYIKDNELASAVFQLDFMANQVADGNTYSREEIKEIFTTMLEKLTKD